MTRKPLPPPLRSYPAVARVPRNVGGDQRGVILLPALVMGALLTGALFYVAAVGDAMLFRTELSNAADATAFKSAVWHARGMNVVAILNLFMSLALAVFAALRIAEIVLFLLGLIPIIGGPLGTAAGSLVKAEPAIFRVVNTALEVAERAQGAVSAAVPYVALADAKSTPTAASTVWPLTMSLLPPQADARLGQPTRRPSDLPAALPIEDGEFGVLCAKATTFLPNQLSSLARRANLPGSGRFDAVANTLLDDIGGRVIGAGDGLFCQPINGLISSLVDLLTEEACDQVRAEDQQLEDEAVLREEREEREAARRAEQGGDSANGDSADSDSAEREERRRERRGRRVDGSRREPLDCEGGIAAVPDQATAALTFTVAPAQVWSPAANGNVFFHSWSWVEGEPRFFPGDQQGVGIAAAGREPAVTPSTTAVAMAEYYFDCDEGWDEHCEPDALWAPNWTARMRRFRSPGEELGRIGLDYGTDLLDTLQQSVGDHASDEIGDEINDLTGLPSDNSLARWLGEQIDRLPVVREISETIDAAVGGMREASGLDDLLDPRGYTNPDRIH